MSKSTYFGHFCDLQERFEEELNKLQNSNKVIEWNIQELIEHSKICGTYKGKLVSIIYQPREYLIISIEDNDMIALNELIEIANLYIANLNVNYKKPIALYNMIRKSKIPDGQEKVIPTVEWDFLDPKGRKKYIQSNLIAWEVRNVKIL